MLILSGRSNARQRRTVERCRRSLASRFDFFSAPLPVCLALCLDEGGADRRICPCRPVVGFLQSLHRGAKWDFSRGKEPVDRWRHIVEIGMRRVVLEGSDLADGRLGLLSFSLGTLGHDGLETLLDGLSYEGFEVLRLALRGCLIGLPTEDGARIEPLAAEDMFRQLHGVVNAHTRKLHHLALRLDDGARMVDQKLAVGVE